jgi:hypothetical protein
MWRVVIACIHLFASAQLMAVLCALLMSAPAHALCTQNASGDWACVQVDRVVDLNAPGALEALARENPERHRKIVTVLEQVQRYRIRDVPQWLQTTLGAQQAQYTVFLRVSNPPKRDLSFVLEGTRYQARVIEPVDAEWLQVLPRR